MSRGPDGGSRLRVLWGRIRDSLWFVPSLTVLLAIVLGVALVELSGMVDDEALARWPRVFGAGPDGARAMLSAIAGSMITVAGVTFSITMVAVTQASTQYSPRILRNFMRDRANQAVLGTFVGIFAYCLVVLRTIREGDGSEFVPSIAVLVGVLLALVGVAVLIFFVHHIATTLQASEIIARIAGDTRRVLDRMYPEEGADDVADAAPGAMCDAVPAGRWLPVTARDSGYIQHVDLGRLVGIARRSGLLVRLTLPTGDFVVQGQPTARYTPHPRAAGAGGNGHRESDPAAAMAGAWLIGTYRSLDQDPAFGVRQLVDVALRAISPGLNDATTAATCIDHLGAILARVADRRVPRAHLDSDGRVRVVTAAPGFEELLELSVREIRQSAHGNVSVLLRLAEMLGRLAAATPAPGRRRALAHQAELVRATAAQTVTAGPDLESVEAAARGALEVPYGGEGAVNPAAR